MLQSSQAYPYANALFEIANNEQKLDQWLSDLSRLAQFAQHKGFDALIGNPTLSREDVINTLTSVLDNPNTLINNFLFQLQENGRLKLLPSIFELFEGLVLAKKNNAKGIVQSAYPLNDSDKKELEQLLTKKYGKNIALEAEVNPQLIGGVKIFINDAVIDASIKGSLEKMATEFRK